jgi:hypothetical protein
VKKIFEEIEGKKNESIIYKKNNESLKKKVEISNMHTFVGFFFF